MKKVKKKKKFLRPKPSLSPYSRCFDSFFPLTFNTEILVTSLPLPNVVGIKILDFFILFATNFATSNELPPPKPTMLENFDFENDRANRCVFIKERSIEESIEAFIASEAAAGQLIDESNPTVKLIQRGLLDNQSICSRNTYPPSPGARSTPEKC